MRSRRCRSSSTSNHRFDRLTTRISSAEEKGGDSVKTRVVLCFFPSTGDFLIPIVLADPEGLLRTEGMRAAYEVMRVLGRLEE